jgi:molybdopterin converting factor small subunit
MMVINVKFLGGLRQDMGMASTMLDLPDNATVADLENRLRALGIELDTQVNIAVLNQCGLSQLPQDQQIAPDDVVMIFPNIAGGSRNNWR